jgi:hypothetical protein
VDPLLSEKTRKERESVDAEDAPFDWRTRNPKTPLELLIEKEEEQEYQLLRADFEAEFERPTRGNLLALQYLAVTQDEIYDPNEQARLLGITLAELHTLRARVRRVLDRFLADRKKKP